ncbi:hypothetical protein AFM11_21000 [Mycolicibacterium wolinskyi]|uniref:Uncharacterized protein n=1 Tax=Mycolicibacterium wolinskyi TaxID=59750 RepID=A0A132PJ36_9MYCO|nr:hypothetical protein [Mycolicibacterium wolinskyi]KWX22313.1 hypothetical protein AFM11_21000 [Mycolicibacterium wolinskyi]
MSDTETVETTDRAGDAVETTETVEAPETLETTETDQDDSATLAKVRREAKNLRDRAKAAEARADELARELWTARVAATGKLDNPAELPFDAEILDDADAINQAIEAAIAQRPYIKSRKLSGNVGQGQRGESTGPHDFSGLFRRDASYN